MHSKDKGIGGEQYLPFSMVMITNLYYCKYDQ